jgi:tetratricopeptide (TPR) repeat protein
MMIGAAPFSAQTFAELVRNAHDCFDTMDFETGLRLANRALESDPRLWTLRLRQAVVLKKLGRDQVAWMILAKAIEAAGKEPGSPESFGPQALAALWKYQDGQFEESRLLAREAARKAEASLHPGRGAKPDWPPAFAPGLTVTTGDGEANARRRIFPPNAGLAAYLLGVHAERESGWGREAEECFLAAQRLSYDARDCAIRIALGRMSSGDYRGAVRAALAACDEGGLHPDLCMALAAAHSAAGARREAGDFLSLAVDLEPYQPARLRALAAAEEAEGRRAEAVSILERALRLNPVDMTSRDYLERLEGGRGLPAGAFSEAVRAALDELRRDLEPRWTYSLWRTQAAVAAYVNNRFSRYLSEGLVDDAAGLLGAFLRLDSSSPTLLYNLALLESSRGRPDKALPLAWQAAARKPDYGNALDEAGRLLLILGDFDRSVLLYEEALALEPGDPTAWYNLACARFAGGDGAGAEADLTRAMELDRAGAAAGSGDRDVAQRSGQSLRSGAFGRMRPSPRPSAASEKPSEEKVEGVAHALTVGVDSIRCRALTLLASIRLERGESQAALVAAEEAVRIEPDSPDAYLELGRIRLALGQAAAAEAAFAKYLALGGSPAKAQAVCRTGASTGRTP